MGHASHPRACQADPRVAHARELLNQALHQREIGDASGALEKLKAAYSLVRTPILALELARTHVQLGKLVEARETLLSVARIPVRSEETARSAAARDQSAHLADEIRARLASITIRVTGAASGAVTVTIDGTAMPAEALGTTRLVDPGLHAVIAQAPEGAPSEKRVELREGEAREVHLTIGTPQPPSPRSATASGMALAGGTGSTDNTAPGKVSSRWNPLVYAGIGLAGAGVVVGTATGLLSVSKESSVNDACGAGFRCPHSRKYLYYVKEHAVQYAPLDRSSLPQPLPGPAQRSLSVFAIATAVGAVFWFDGSNPTIYGVASP